MNVIHLFTTEEGSCLSEEKIAKINPGDFIQGLTYPQLLVLEERLRARIKNILILLTGSGYGFISQVWE